MEGENPTGPRTRMISTTAPVKTCNRQLHSSCRRRGLSAIALFSTVAGPSLREQGR